MTDATLEEATRELVSKLDLDATETGAEGDVAEEGTMRIGRRCYIGPRFPATAFQPGQACRVVCPPDTRVTQGLESSFLALVL